MEQNETFQMTYSAKEQQEIEAIRKKYAPPEQSKMDQLRAMDAQATGKATRHAVSVGVVGTLIMGLGMSLVMSDFGAFLGNVSFFGGIAVGILGMAILVSAYPLYCRRLKKEREKIAPEILRLTEELKK